MFSVLFDAVVDTQLQVLLLKFLLFHLTGQFRDGVFSLKDTLVIFFVVNLVIVSVCLLVDVIVSISLSISRVGVENGWNVTEISRWDHKYRCMLSLQNRCFFSFFFFFFFFFFAFFRCVQGSASHARRKGREKNNALLPSYMTRACLRSPEKRQNNNACSTG